MYIIEPHILEHLSPKLYGFFIPSRHGKRSTDEGVTRWGWMGWRL